MDQVSQVLLGGRFVLNEDEQEMQSKSGDEFLISCVVNGTEVRDTL